MPPRPPKTAAAAAAQVEFKTWDQYVAEATADKPIFKLPVAEDEVLEIPCPTGQQMLDMDVARRSMDTTLLALSTFGDEAGTRILELWKGAPYPAMNAVAMDVMEYYAPTDPAQLPES